jgi:hypothetical protein
MEKRLSTYLGRPAVRTEAGKEAMTIALLVLLAMFLTGVGVTYGIL